MAPGPRRYRRLAREMWGRWQTAANSTEMSVHWTWELHHISPHPILASSSFSEPETRIPSGLPKESRNTASSSRRRKRTRLRWTLPFRSYCAEVSDKRRTTLDTSTLARWPIWRQQLKSEGLKSGMEWRRRHGEREGNRGKETTTLMTTATGRRDRRHPQTLNSAKYIDKQCDHHLDHPDTPVHFATLSLAQND